MARRCSFVKRTNKKNRNRTRNRTRTRTRNRTNNKNRTKRINQKGGAFELLCTLNSYTGIIYSVAFDPTGVFLATGSSYIGQRRNVVKLWPMSAVLDVARDTTNSVINNSRYDDTVIHSNSSVLSVAFHPKAHLLATGSADMTAKLWSFQPLSSAAADEYLSSTCLATLMGHTGSVNSVAFHPNPAMNLLATGSADMTAKLWRFSANTMASSVTCVATLMGHTGSVNSVAFHPTAPLLATGSYDYTAKLWSFSPDGSRTTCVATLNRSSSWVTSVAFHPTAPLLATGSSDKTAKLWNITVENTVTHEDIQPIIVSDDDDTRLLDTDGENKSQISKIRNFFRFGRKYNV